MVLVLLYRVCIASLLEAFHAMPSLQRRRLLEEEGFRDPLLVRLLKRPHAFGLGLALWNQALLVLLAALFWPLRPCFPGSGWVLALLALVYIWAMDMALPTLLTASDPGLWIGRLFPLYGLFHPLLAPLVGPLARFVARRREAHDRDDEGEGDNDDAVTALLEEGEAEGILEEDDRELIRNVVGFRDTVVREVMTPRTRIHAVPVDAPAEAVWNAFRDSRHSRMPVFEGTVDHIVGVLLIKDLLQLPTQDALDILAVARPPIFVPESKHILELLRELQRTGNQLAVVVDEFGSVSGIATLEDLLEEVFGEIREEHEHGTDFEALPSGDFLVSGQVHVEDLEEHLGFAWERDGFDTLAGLVMARLGRVPLAGESVLVEGARLTVVKMEGARILQVLLKPIGPVPSSEWKC
jgi:putative hemolysin